MLLEPASAGVCAKLTPLHIATDKHRCKNFFMSIS
jgi:hypothetical protein